MIDPLLAKARQISDPRVARTTSAKPTKRTKPAQTSKIITAGASATALFGMVAAMGWQAGTGNATASTPTVAVQSVATDPAVVDVPVVAVPVPTIAVPTTVVPATPVVTLPAATVPVATPAPVVVPVVVPVAKPVVKQVSNKRASNTVTKSSS